jgi:hypothetical protein
VVDSHVEPCLFCGGYPELLPSVKDSIVSVLRKTSGGLTEAQLVARAHGPAPMIRFGIRELSKLGSIAVSDTQRWTVVEVWERSEVGTEEPPAAMAATPAPAVEAATPVPAAAPEPVAPPTPTILEAYIAAMVARYGKEPTVDVADLRQVAHTLKGWPSEQRVLLVQEYLAEERQDGHPLSGLVGKAPDVV